jgi:hypothetical protein
LVAACKARRRNLLLSVPLDGQPGGVGRRMK